MKKTHFLFLAGLLFFGVSCDDTSETNLEARVNQEATQVKSEAMVNFEAALLRWFNAKEKKDDNIIKSAEKDLIATCIVLEKELSAINGLSKRECGVSNAQKIDYTLAEYSRFLSFNSKK